MDLVAANKPQRLSFVSATQPLLPRPMQCSLAGDNLEAPSAAVPPMGAPPSLHATWSRTGLPAGSPTWRSCGRRARSVSPPRACPPHRGAALLASHRSVQTPGLGSRASREATPPWGQASPVCPAHIPWTLDQPRSLSCVLADSPYPGSCSLSV